jgi:DNA polymerase-3 subunit gamma/tau
MSDEQYRVIAREWRPKTFEEVIGQPHATRTLRNAIRLNRIAHAYLFSGARGVGKTSVARILARALNCEKGPTPVPCNQCSNCLEILKTNSVDVIEIDGASNRGIDNIRELRETVRYKPAKGRFKIYIIDEVHMLTTEAFNALLKTLEEPPAHVVFIFATTEPHKIPATILSRCQRFDFRRLSLQQITDHLGKIASQQKADFSEGILYAIAREADGSMRDAQSLLEQLMAFSEDDLPETELLDILGVIDRQSILLTAEAILSGNAPACLDLVADVYRRGIDSRRFCQHLCDHFRNLLLTSISGDREAQLDLPEDEKKLLKDQAASTTPESLHVYFQMLLGGEEQIRRSSMPKIALEMLLLRMAQLPKLKSLDVLLETIASIEQSSKTKGGGRRVEERGRGAEKRIESDNVSAEAGHVSEFFDDGGGIHGGQGRIRKAERMDKSPRDAGHNPPELFQTGEAQEPQMSSALPPRSAVPGSVDDALENWGAFVAFLENHNPILWAKVSHCKPGTSDGLLELEVPEIFENSTNGPDFVREIEDASQAFFGFRLHWSIIKRSSKPFGNAAAHDRKAGKSSYAKQIAGHPAVHQAIEILGAELIEVKPAAEGEPNKFRRRKNNK